MPRILRSIVCLVIGSDTEGVLAIELLGFLSVTNIVFTTDGAEQKALADYLKQAGTITLADPTSETALRQQDLSARADTVLSPVFTQLLPQGAGVSVSAARRL